MSDNADWALVRLFKDGTLAKHPAFIWPVYSLFVLPISMYILHDVIDSRWRSLRHSAFFSRLYLVLNVMFMLVAPVYIAAQLASAEKDDKDHKEAAAIVVAFLLNLFAVIKVVRGSLVGRMLSVLGEAFLLVQDGVVQPWAGPLSQQVASSFMDDDYPGGGPRINWIVPLLRLKALRGPFFRVLIDEAEYVLVAVAWAWRALGQTQAVGREPELLCWMTSALDRGVAAGFVLAYGCDLRTLDVATGMKTRNCYVEGLRLTDRQPYSPLKPYVEPKLRPGQLTPTDVLKPPSATEAATENMDWVRQSLPYTMEVVKLCVACMLSKKTLHCRGDDNLWDGKDCCGLMLSLDSTFQKGQEFKVVTMVAAREYMTSLLFAAASDVFHRVPHRRDHLGSDAGKYTTAMLRRVPRTHERQRGHSVTDTSTLAMSRLTPVSLASDLSCRPALINAYATSLVCLLCMASVAAPAEQKQALASLPAVAYELVSVPRLAFIASMDLASKLARLGHQHGYQDVQSDTVQLLHVCTRLLDCGDRLLLSQIVEDNSLSPGASNETHVQQLRALMLETFETMLTALWEVMDEHEETKTSMRWRVVHQWSLYPRDIENVSVMMALAFSAVLCGGSAMVHGKKDEALQDLNLQASGPAHGTVATAAAADLREQNLEPGATDAMIAFAALHHAISFGWEYMFAHALGGSKKYKIPQSAVRSVQHMLSGWGVTGFVVEISEEADDSPDQKKVERRTWTNKVEMLTPAAVARAALGPPEMRRNPSDLSNLPWIQNEASFSTLIIPDGSAEGLSVGSSLSDTFTKLNDFKRSLAKEDEVVGEEVKHKAEGEQVELSMV